VEAGHPADDAVLAHRRARVHARLVRGDTGEIQGRYREIQGDAVLAHGRARVHARLVRARARARARARVRARVRIRVGVRVGVGCARAPRREI